MRCGACHVNTRPRKLSSRKSIPSYLFTLYSILAWFHCQSEAFEIDIINNTFVSVDSLIVGEGCDKIWSKRCYFGPRSWQLKLF